MTESVLNHGSHPWATESVLTSMSLENVRIPRTELRFLWPFFVYGHIGRKVSLNLTVLKVGLETASLICLSVFFWTAFQRMSSFVPSLMAYLNTVSIFVLICIKLFHCVISSAYSRSLSVSLAFSCLRCSPCSAFS